MGIDVLQLNIGNPAPFGVLAPDEIIHDMKLNIKDAQGYCDSKGLFAARKAIMQYCQVKKIPNVSIEDIYVGNGVSEMISISMQALLNNGDEVLVPTPSYPLWTASVTLAGGTPVHYVCDPKANWYPDLDVYKRQIRAFIVKRRGLRKAGKSENEGDLNEAFWEKTRCV